MAKQKLISYDTSHILLEWKEQVFDLLQAKYPKKRLSREKVYQKLDRMIQENIDNPKISLINNYTNQNVRSDLLTLIDLIEDNHLIIGGGGCIFHQHATKPNILIDFILDIMAKRSFWKKERKKYKKGTDEYRHCDLMQNLFKLIINSLYGCLGYPGFVLYNVFLAEAITNQGKHIITTAIGCFEGFLGDGIKFDTKGEVFNFIHKIHSEYQTQILKDTRSGVLRNGKLDYKPFEVPNILSACVRRLIEKCSFPMTQEFIDSVSAALAELPKAELHVIYYKNNLLSFLRTPLMKGMLKEIITSNGQLVLPDIDALKSEHEKSLLSMCWALIDTYVFYRYPIYDRVRKAMYTDKSRSLYTDTDSVFISLDQLVHYYEEEVLCGEVIMDLDMQSATSANIMMIFVNYAIDKALKALCASMNVTPEWAKKLGMKNEFFFKKILFTDKKKRYISLALLQEGVLLNDGKGLDEIKGFDFKKAGTKEYLRELYTRISLDDILYPAEIDPTVVFEKIASLKSSIEADARAGEMKFFKQSAVKEPDQYKNPYQIQGVTAILFWNALCPEYQMEFPNDVNIVPVLDLRWEDGNKRNPLDVPNIRKFAEKYPEAFERLEREIYGNPNELIRHMGMKYIATPKNPDIPVPDLVYDIIDYDKLTSDAINLFLPVMNSIGIKSLDVTGNVSNLSNFVDL